MGVVDLIIIGIIILGGIIGAKNGLLKQAVSFIGFIVIIVLAYLFKGIVASWMFKNLPFFKFGILRGASILNILVYEVIAFFIVFTILLIIYKILLKVTGLVQKIFDATIVLSIPSRLLGGLLGILEYSVLAFVVLLVIGLPIFKSNIAESSKIRNKVLTKTPILSNVTDKSVKFINELESIKDKYKDDTSNNTFNLESLDLMLKYKITSKDDIKILIEKKKLNIKNIDEVLEKY